MINLFTDKTRWCWHPDLMPKAPCFVFFRKAFLIKEKGCKLKLNASADNRYNLFLDGQIIGRGPCRSDLQHYNYEEYSVKIDPGEHVLSAHVAVYGGGCRGKEVALAEMHGGSGFIIGGGIFKNEKCISRLDTFEGWKCSIDTSRFHRSLDAENDLKTYAVIPPMEKVDFSNFPLKWMDYSFDDSTWNEPKDIGSPVMRETINDPYTQWWLTPRQIPMMEEKREIFRSVVKSEGVDLSAASAWISGGKGLKITRDCNIVLDVGHLTTAFPKLEFDGGKGATVRITYSESLFVDGKKLERDNKEGIVFGYSDLLNMDGNPASFEPFWFRTFRFVEIKIIFRKSASLIIKPPLINSFMYPFNLRANFNAGNREIRKVWDIAWRTARLCAHEHYYDCPYYEQLQYTGDTRIQALISYSATGDGRLGRQAILQYDWSRLAEGITQSRYPSTWTQVIVGFSLYWVMMVRDHYEYFGDKELVKEVMPGIKSVLDWFERHRLENNLIGHLRFWNFTDWIPEWTNGEPSRNTNKPITINTLQYADACRTAAYLAKEIGDSSSGGEFLKRYRRSIDAVNRLCFDRKLGLYVDMPGTQFISQHTNSWAIISDAVTGEKAKKLGREIFMSDKMSKATLYFSFYLFRAWDKLGTYEFFWKQLENWKSVLKWNFTTFPEIPGEKTRSDCHAWSASPVFELISCILGVKPASPGFDTILIKPGPSEFRKISGKAPVGKETIDVSVERTGKNEMILSFSLKTPKNIVVEWPDGEKERLGKVKSGTIKTKI